MFKKGYVFSVIILSVLFIGSFIYNLFNIPSDAVDCHGESGCVLYKPIKGSVAAVVDLNTGNSISFSTIPELSSFSDEIIALRQHLGGFSTIEQLMQVKGIGLKTFLAIAPYVKCNNDLPIPNK
ncbi:MAG: helix-hairpin-helix domain-containing protein [Clostridia bacterium]|nr:helix-hairpin-helix domain-containing protein [Clostridia bacterium]